MAYQWVGGRDCPFNMRIFLRPAFSKVALGFARQGTTVPSQARRRWAAVSSIRALSSGIFGQNRLFDPQYNAGSSFYRGHTFGDGGRSALFASIALATGVLGAQSLSHCEEGQEQERKKKKSAVPLTADFIADAVEVAVPALVNLTVNIKSPWGGAAQAAGSGFIVSKDGFVVTNNHVVSPHGHTKGEVIVTMSNGRSFKGKVHSRDAKSDLALVKIESKETFPTMKLGTSSSLRPGQLVIALGSPLTLQNTVTAGIISSVARHSSEIGAHGHKEYIQTDASINVGNSGGPLIDIDGRVIGINTMKAAQGDGIGFAIPIDTAWQVIKQLRAHRKVVRPYIGIKMVTLDSRILAHERAINKGFPNVESGVMVVQVAKGSPAQKAGLKTGDLIINMHGKKIASTRDVLDALGAEVGKKIRMEIMRPPDAAKKVFHIIPAAMTS